MGLCLSKQVFEPPTKIDNLPSAAKSTALVTGASRKSTLRVPANFVSSITRSTALVEVSITVVPGHTADKIPVLPSMAARTWSGPGSEAITTSAAAAPSARLDAQVAP